MSISDNFYSLPRKTKGSLVLGIVLALTVALPLFVWTALYVNFNVKEKAAEDGSNYCGGTCGSNLNCQPNLYCYNGFCRNPICSDDTDCACTEITPTSSPILQPVVKVTPKPTTNAVTSPTPNPKGGNENYNNLINETPPPYKPNKQLVEEEELEAAPENQFVAKYAFYIFIAFVLIALTTIYFAMKKKKNQIIPHIMPPTNI